MIKTKHSLTKLIIASLVLLFVSSSTFIPVSAQQAIPNTPGVTTPAVKSGTSYYVSPGGGGISTNRGAPGAVGATINAICQQIQGGDEIVFLAGTYLTSSTGLSHSKGGGDPYGNSGGITFRSRHCVTDGKYIIIRSDTPQAAVIKNNMAGTSNSNIDIRDSSYISVQDFRIEGINVNSSWYEFGVSFAYGSHHVQISGNKVYGVGGAGIAVHENSDKFSVINNEVYDSASKHPYCTSNMNFVSLNNIGGGDDAFGYSNYVLNNKSVGARSRGSDIGNPLGDCDSNGTQPGGVKSDGNCIIFDYNSHRGYTNRSLISGNICVDTGGGGIHFYDSGYADVVGNIVYFSGRQYHTGGGRLPDLSASCYGAAATSINFVSNIAYAAPDGNPAKEGYIQSCASGNSFTNNIFVGSNAPGPEDFVSTRPGFTTNLAEAISCTGANAINVNPADVFVTPPTGDGRSSDFTLKTTGAFAGYKPCNFDVPLPGGSVSGGAGGGGTLGKIIYGTDNASPVGVIAPQDTPAEDLDVTTVASTCADLSDSSCRIVGLLNNALAVISLITVPLIVIGYAIGGIKYATGQGNPQALSEAHALLKKSTIALVMYIFIYSFLQWIIPGGIF